MSIAVKIAIFANPTDAIVLIKVSMGYDDKKRHELSYLLFSISVHDRSKKKRMNAFIFLSLILSR
jgi:hypothetical protein